MNSQRSARESVNWQNCKRARSESSLWLLRQTGHKKKELLYLLQVSFQTTVGRNLSRFIAIDDVTLTNGLCEDESEPQSNRQGISLNSSFNFVVEDLMVSALAPGTSGAAYLLPGRCVVF